MRNPDSSSGTRGHDIIVIGASAGGVEALTELAANLPSDLPAAVFVVLHIPPYSASVLPAILSRRGRLPALHPEDGEEIQPGRIYIAPPDRHLLIEDGRVRLTRGPAENGHRPAVDTLFRSAALAHGPRVVGVVLTGALDDGTAGMQDIKKRGGLGIAQDPDDALFPSMPRSVMENVPIDFVLPLAQIPATLARLTRPAPPQGSPMPAVDTAAPPKAEPKPETGTDIDAEVGVAALDMDALEQPRDGQPSAYACPDCHGVLWEVEEGALTRFRCRVGHAFSPQSLLAAQSAGLEEALWTALRALEESAALADRLSERASERGHALAADRFGEQAGDTRGRARVIRQVLTEGEVIANSGPPPDALNARTEPPA